MHSQNSLLTKPYAISVRTSTVRFGNTFLWKHDFKSEYANNEIRKPNT